MLWVKVRDYGHVSNKTDYLALGVTMEGFMELLGMWAAESEGAKSSKNSEGTSPLVTSR